MILNANRYEIKIANETFLLQWEFSITGSTLSASYTQFKCLHSMLLLRMLACDVFVLL